MKFFLKVVLVLLAVLVASVSHADAHSAEIQGKPVQISFRDAQFRVLDFISHRVWNGLQNPLSDTAVPSWERKLKRLTIEIVSVGDGTGRDLDSVSKNTVSLAHQYLTHNAKSLDVTPDLSSGKFQGGGLGASDFVKSIKKSKSDVYSGWMVVIIQNNRIAGVQLTGTVRKLR